MRIIILIQSFVILVGAYYIYTLSRAVTVSETPPVIQIERRVPAAEDNYVPPAGNPPADDGLEASSTSGVLGPNDAGMEYPIIDGSIQVQ